MMLRPAAATPIRGAHRPYSRHRQGTRPVSGNLAMLRHFDLAPARRLPAAALAVSLAASVGAFETARMELPADFATRAERITIEGFGGHNKGTYEFRDFSGEFRRGESRLGIFDPFYVSNKGQSSFTLTGPGTSGEFAADCEMKKGAVTVGIVTFDPKKLSYRCEFRENGRLADAQFVLGQPKYDSMKERMLAKDLRRGEAIVFDQHFLIESVHRYAGSPISSQAPVGYLVHSGDRLVAAVELTDVNPSVYVLGDDDEPTRKATSIVALALAVLRDPAHSALEE